MAQLSVTSTNLADLGVLMEYIKITPPDRGGKEMKQAEVRQYFSENTRQSFAAEGISVPRDDWDKIMMRLAQIF